VRNSFSTGIHELRMDATRRRLGWTAIADISPVTLVVRTEDRRCASGCR